MAIGEEGVANSMALQMSESVSLDLRDLMAEQLNEIRALRESMEKASEDVSSATGILPADQNPYIMNPYYTEHHDEVINDAMSQVSSAHEKVIDKNNGFFSTVGEYANDTGFSQTFFGDRVLDGRGVSAKEADLAKMQFGDKLVNRFFDKTGTAIQTVGADAAFSLSSFGGIPGIATGMAVGAVTSWGIGRGIDDIESYQDYRNTLYARSNSFIDSSESTNRGGGFTKRESRQAARTLNSLDNWNRTTKDEISEIFEGAIENNLLTDLSDIDEFEDKMTNLVAAVKKTATTLGVTLTEATDMMGELERAGIGTGTQSLLIGGMNETASALGMSVQDYNSLLASQVENRINGSAADANVTALSTNTQNMTIAGIKSDIGQMSDTSKTNVDKYFENSNVSFDSVFYAAEQGNYSPILQAIQEASLVENEVGNLVVDKDLFNRNVEAYKSGDPDVYQDMIKKVQSMSQGDLSFRTNAASALETFSRESMDTLAPGAADIIVTAATKAGMNALGISQADYDEMPTGKQEAVTEIGLSGLSYDQSMAVQGISKYTDNTTAAYGTVKATFDTAANRAENDGWFFKTNLPEYLKDYDITNEVDYTNLTSDNARQALTQGERTINGILIGSAVDEKFVASYKNKMLLNSNQAAAGYGNGLVGANADIDVFAEALMDENLVRVDGNADGLGNYVKSVGGVAMYNDLIKARESDNSEAANEIAKELMTITEESIKNSNVATLETREGKTTDEAISAIEDNSTALEKLLDTIVDEFGNRTVDLLDVIKTLSGK